jgi:hypothetical protein
MMLVAVSAQKKSGEAGHTQRIYNPEDLSRKLLSQKGLSISKQLFTMDVRVCVHAHAHVCM